ncbi:MAG: hypothetical protein GXP14_03795 [Gammaproteobacteria bacterium]|nr:hypothetical protein [Gammaproteobacteria bacterium]
MYRAFYFSFALFFSFMSFTDLSHAQKNANSQITLTIEIDKMATAIPVQSVSCHSQKKKRDASDLNPNCLKFIFDGQFVNLEVTSKLLTEEQKTEATPSIKYPDPTIGINEKFNPGHYMISSGNIKKDWENVEDAGDIFTGIHKTYYWRNLEPEEGKYNFKKIENDLAYVKSIEKRLVVVLNDTNWVAQNRAEFGAPNYLFQQNYADGAFRFDNSIFVTKAYNTNVSNKMQLLIQAIGKKLDQNIFLEAFIVSGTFLGVRDGENLVNNADDYNVEQYIDEIKKRMLVMKKSFPTTNVIQYIDYIDDENEDNNLSQIVDFGKKIGVGIGGLDIDVYGNDDSDNELNPSYHYYSSVAGLLPLGAEIGWDSYNTINPRTEEKVTPEDIIDFGLNNLKLNYFFWDDVIPYFFRDAVPELKKTGSPINDLR